MDDEAKNENPETDGVTPIGGIDSDLNKTHNHKMSENIDIMTWFDKGVFDIKRSAASRRESIEQNEALLKAETFKLERDLSTYLSINGIENHDYWLDKVSKIVINILAKSADNINNMYDVIENKILDGETRNHKTIQRAVEMHSKGILDDSELKAKKEIIKSGYEEFATELRTDLTAVFNHQSNALKLAVHNFVEAESKNRGLDSEGFKVNFKNMKTVN